MRCYRKCFVKFLTPFITATIHRPQNLILNLHSAVVTKCTTWWNIYRLYSAHIVHLCVWYDGLNGDYFPKHRNWLVFITEAEFVFHEVETEFQ
jgi:hypothetical protein